MARSGKAAQGSKWEPAGEKHRSPVEVSGGLAVSRKTQYSGHRTQDYRPCDLCARLRSFQKTPSRRLPGSGPLRGLRVVLVDEDDATRVAAKAMVRAQHDVWTLTAYAVPKCGCPFAMGHLPLAIAPTQDSRRGTQDSRPPDVVLIGVQNSDLTRLACVRKLKALAPDIPAVVISARWDAAAIVQCCMTGANGCLMSPMAPEDLGRALSAVARGEAALCPEAQTALVNALHRAAKATTTCLAGLTRREQEIVACVLACLSDKEISDRLGMKRDTVHVHLVRLYRKLGVHSRHEVAKRLCAGGESNPF